jgi:Glycine-zipper domain
VTCNSRSRVKPSFNHDRQRQPFSRPKRDEVATLHFALYIEAGRLQKAPDSRIERSFRHEGLAATVSRASLQLRLLRSAIDVIVQEPLSGVAGLTSEPPLLWRPMIFQSTPRFDRKQQQMGERSRLRRVSPSFIHMGRKCVADRKMLFSIVSVAVYWVGAASASQVQTPQMFAQYYPPPPPAYYAPPPAPPPCAAVTPGPLRGAGRGAARGALIGSISGNAGRGAAIGATVGGVAGAARHGTARAYGACY